MIRLFFQALFCFVVFACFPKHGGDKDEDGAEHGDYGKQNGRYDKYDHCKDSEEEFRDNHPENGVDVERYDKSR